MYCIVEAHYEMTSRPLWNARYQATSPGEPLHPSPILPGIQIAYLGAHLWLGLHWQMFLCNATLLDDTVSATLVLLAPGLWTVLRSYPKISVAWVVVGINDGDQQDEDAGED